jgi:hypothetical protein
MNMVTVHATVGNDYPHALANHDVAGSEFQAAIPQAHDETADWTAQERDTEFDSNFRIHILQPIDKRRPPSPGDVHRDYRNQRGVGHGDHHVAR